jgi:adenylate kinase
MTNVSQGLSDETCRDISTASEVGVVLLIGPPGAGKGKQARALSRFWHIPHISMGELLRIQAENGTSLGRTVKATMSRGELVSDSLVKELIEVRLLESDTGRGYILDGFPRTLEQAVWLSRRVGMQSRQTTVLAVNIILSRAQLLRRVTGRRHCPLCQATFNIYENLPEINGACDWDNCSLIQRPDDTGENFIRRLKQHHLLASPVIEHFHAQGQLVEVSGDGPIEWITQRIIGARCLVTSQFEMCASRAL